MEEDEVEVGVEGKENAENILPQGIEMQTRKRKEKKDGKEDGGEGDPLFKIEGKLDEVQRKEKLHDAAEYLIPISLQRVNI